MISYDYVILNVVFSFPCTVSNPCETYTCLNCSHACIVDDYLPHCECDRGYKLEPDRQTCSGNHALYAIVNGICTLSSSV